MQAGRKPFREPLTRFLVFEATMFTPEVPLWRSLRVARLLVLTFALLLFSINLDRPPHPDELHHALAAKGLLETGRPALAEGEYWRGLPHTWMVAVSYAIFLLESDALFWAAAALDPGYRYPCRDTVL